jgi:hypothetical protein
MATFRNRHGKWQARVARKGIKPISKSFQNKQDTERWASHIKTNIDGATTAIWCWLNTHFNLAE